MSLTPEEMARRLAEMRTQFRGRLKVRLDEVAASLEAARRGAKPELEDLRHLVHKLHGTVGSYGMQDVADPLREMEMLLDPALEGSEQASPLDALTALLVRARAAAAAE